MTRFEMELSGKLGEYWVRNAQNEIAKMQEKADNGEILLDHNFAAYWEVNGNYLPSDCVEILSHTKFFFDAEATNKAREKQDAEFFSNYWKNRTGLSEETLFEMRAAFGEGTLVVDVITGQEFKL